MIVRDHAGDGPVARHRIAVADASPHTDGTGTDEHTLLRPPVRERHVELGWDGGRRSGYNGVSARGSTRPVAMGRPCRAGKTASDATRAGLTTTEHRLEGRQRELAPAEGGDDLFVALSFFEGILGPDLFGEAADRCDDQRVLAARDQPSAITGSPVALICSAAPDVEGGDVLRRRRYWRRARRRCPETPQGERNWESYAWIRDSTFACGACTAGRIARGRRFLPSSRRVGAYDDGAIPRQVCMAWRRAQLVEEERIHVSGYDKCAYGDGSATAAYNQKQTSLGFDAATGYLHARSRARFRRRCGRCDDAKQVEEATTLEEPTAGSGRCEGAAALQSRQGHVLGGADRGRPDGRRHG